MVLRDARNKIIASGELTQTVQEHRIISRLVYRFRDGSLDDETTVFQQDGHFRLVEDQHIQMGPPFPRPYSATIDATTDQVIVQEGTKPVATKHMALPFDLSNGLLLTAMRNLLSGNQDTELSYLAVSSKPRTVSGHFPCRRGPI